MLCSRRHFLTGATMDIDSLALAALLREEGWVAGGGFKGGHTHGATDEFAHKAVTDVVTHTDYQHTLLHLFGLDAKKLVYKRQAQEFTLTDHQAGRVVKELLA